MTRTASRARLRPERLIAAGRIVLGISALFAVWLDPTEPAKYAQVAYGLLVAYVVYAVSVAAIMWRVDGVSTRWPAFTHAADLVFFSLFIFFTAGPGSPFTVYFVFALLCATLRWQSRGTLWTAIASLGVFFTFGIYFGVWLGDPAFELLAFIIRGVYLVVLAVLLGYVGAQDRRTMREMWLLASWPQTSSRDAERLVEALLGYAAPLLDAPRAALVWTEPDAPWRRGVVWDRGRCTHHRHAADAGPVAAALERRSFIYTPPPRPRTIVQDADGPRFSLWSGDPIDPEFRRLLATGTILSVPLPSECFVGRLFVVGRADTTLDDVVIAEIVAGIVGARLDAFYLGEQLRQSAASEERIRVARDLHDGVLQSFTGIGLRLAAIRRQMATDHQAAETALEEVQRVLASEQRDVRFLIQELRPSTYADDELPLGVRLAELAQRMEREWDLRVQLQVDGAALVPASLDREVFHIIREALVNAARHGAASSARVLVTPPGGLEATGVSISISDNGRGFGFSGCYSADDLATLGLGPKTLRERVLALKGELSLESGPEGAHLRVVLPRAA
jgi:signal transduction histidine kinase